MLPRTESRAHDCLTDLATIALSARLRRREPVSATGRRWLHAPGSLTARLRAHGQVTVVVTREGRHTLWPQEREALQSREGYVREVILQIDGRPAVWARSVTPLPAVKGPWQAIKGLGTRPLAELLFSRRHVLRDPLVCERLPRHGTRHRHIEQEWCRAGAEATGPAPSWCRHSVFWRSGEPLQVMESIAPWVLRLFTPV